MVYHIQFNYLHINFAMRAFLIDPPMSRRITLPIFHRNVHRYWISWPSQSRITKSLFSHDLPIRQKINTLDLRTGLGFLEMLGQRLSTDGQFLFRGLFFMRYVGCLIFSSLLLVLCRCLSFVCMYSFGLSFLFFSPHTSLLPFYNYYVKMYWHVFLIFFLTDLSPQAFAF